MTVRRDPDRFIAAWLADEAPHRAPDHLLAVTRDRVRTTRQRRSPWATWRFERVAGRARLLIAGAAAVVVVVAVIAVDLVPAGDRVGQGASPANPPSLPTGRDASQSALVFPRPGPLPIGSYGAIVNGVSFTFRVPLNGWDSSPATIGMLRDSYYPGRSWLRFWNPDNVYADPCRHTPMSPPVGPSADDLADAMATIPGTVASNAVETTVGGFPARYLELAIADDVPCSTDSFSLWQGGGGSNGEPRTPGARGSRIGVWIVNVDGERLVIDTDVWMPSGASLQPGDDPRGAAGDIATIVDTTRIVAIPRPVLDYADRVLSICTETGQRFEADPAVVGGFRQFAPEFAALDDAAAHAEAAARISGDALRALRGLPAPPEVSRARVDEVYTQIALSIDTLARVPAAARAGDRAGVTSLLSTAYLLSNLDVPPENEPMGLGLLAPSLSGCRLPSSGG